MPGLLPDVLCSPGVTNVPPPVDSLLWVDMQKDLLGLEGMPDIQAW